MKKYIALLLTVIMTVSLVGCGKIDELKEQALASIQDAVNEAQEDLAGGIAGLAEDAAEELAEEAVGSVVGHDPYYFCELFGLNRCPFGISTLGVELNYYFRNGGQLYNWVYSEENTDGWYIYDGYIISADNAWAIKIDEADWFSSCCTYEAKVYTGKTLTKEEQAAQTAGFFHTINSYTPVNTNYGIMIYKESDKPEEIIKDDFTCYGLVDTLKDGEKFSMYIISGWNGEYDGTVKLWAMEHREYSKYPQYFSTEDVEKAVCLGDFSFDDVEEISHIDTFIPNKAAGGLDAGLTDLVITYSDGEELVVGVASVNILASGETASAGTSSGSSSTGDTSDTSAPLVFSGYTEMGNWPDKSTWAGLGLPNLQLGEDVDGTVHISGKDWIYPLNGSDGVMFEARVTAPHIDELMDILNNSDVSLVESDEYINDGYSFYYDNNGTKMKLQIAEWEIDVNDYKMSITVITDPTD